MNIGNLGDVSESFEGEFKSRGKGVSVRYALGPRDTVGQLLYWYGLKRFEPSTLPLFLEMARTSRGILDVGANTGLYAILACAANPGTKVFAWEPVPYLAERLRSNIALNGFEQFCQAREAAAGDRDGEADFYLSDDTTMSSLSKPYATSGGHSSAETRVRIECVDTVVPEDCPIDLLKVDVEGHEFGALSGAIKTLERWHPEIIFECLPSTAAGPIESLLRGLGYSISHLSPKGPEKIDRISAPDNGEYNYLASVK